MSRPNPATLFGFLVVLLLILGGVLIAKDGLYIAKHEGDTLHLMQIVFRMASGEWPHLDFMTPIGALATAPIVFFVDQGFGIGHAIIYSQVLMAAALLPAAWWIGTSRLGPWLAYFFGAVILVLALALVHGEANSSVSVSMHYNRWAWALAFIAIAIALLPPVHRNSPLVDGVLLGMSLASLAMIKVTYFAAFAIPILLALVLRRHFKTLLVSIVVGLIALAIITVFAGVEFWRAYFIDLLRVALSDVRPNPGRPFGAVIGAPLYLGGSLVAIGSVIALRQAGEDVGGVVLLLLAPAFFYVTYQNFGNDPQWLLLLAVLVLAFRPAAGVVNNFGWDMRSTLGILGAITLAFSAPSFLNLAYSPFRHLAADAESYSPMLPRGGVHADLYTKTVRAYRADGKIALDEPGGGLEAYVDLAERDEIGTLLGETLPRCELQLGLTAWFTAIVTDLEEFGHADGSRIFAADLFSSHWLFGDLEPLENGAPWFYGGLPGFKSADYVLVPLCPVSIEVRSKILKLIEDAPDVALTEVRRTPLYILLEKG